MGISLNFSMVFSIIDIINYIAGSFQNVHSKSIVETHEQVKKLMIINRLFGFY